ncbi:MAG: hypothetical protein HYY21_06385, partial [Candidatus Tectomicrobia bacterium]|nr:hypothetical protein [Candidatus Tectomicrobia bacterium]
MKRVYTVMPVPWMLAALFFAVSVSAQTIVADVHRWFNPRTGDHFYTTDP